jgi:putative glycosyltransferase (TIGR04372 family)
MDTHVVTFGVRRVLIARPRGHALGLLLGDVLVAVYVAREAGMALLFLERSETKGSPLLRLRYEDVVILEPTWVRTGAARVLLECLSVGERLRSAVRPIGMACIAVAHRVVAGVSDFHRSDHVLSASAIHRRWVLTIRAWDDVVRKQAARLQPWCKPVARRAAQLLRRDGGTARAWEKAWHGRLQYYKRRSRSGRSVKDDIRAWGENAARRLEAVRRGPGRSAEGAIYEGHDIRAYAAANPLRGRFHPEDDAVAREAAARAGVPTDAPLVTLHVREGKYQALVGAAERGKDYIRNAAIESYGQAIDALVRRGFCVVRIGDPSMPPLRREGVVDLATSPRHDALVDFWCLAQSRFFVACDSGPYLLSWLFDVPCLAVNIVNLLGVYPLRQRDRYLIKRVRERHTGRELALEEMLTEDFVYGFRRRLLKDGELDLIDNAGEDIAAAVEEMADGCDGPPLVSESQARFKALLGTARSGAHSRDKLRGKVGREDAFLGDGWVANSFATRYLSA